MLVRPLTRPLVRPLTRRVTQPGFGWSPRVLFAAGEQGAWYDPSDLSTLFQDSAGTTPVTALGQPVGLMLDKSKGLVRGPELVTTPSVSLTGTAGSNVGASLTAGAWYEISADVSGYSGTGDVGFDGSIFTSSAASRISGNGRISGLAPAVGAFAIRVFTRSTNAATFSNISVRELPGNHAYQTTSTARPTIQARVNLLNASEDFTNASWTKESGVTALAADTVSFPVGTAEAGRLRQAVTVGDRANRQFVFSIEVPPASAWSDPTATLKLAPSIGAATLTITPTGEWQRVSVSVLTESAGMSHHFLLWATKPVTVQGLCNPQMEEGLIPTTYQRVTSATDYADVGAKRYLQFDGVDDWMSIDGNTDWMLGSGSVTMAMAAQRSGTTTAIGHYMLSATKAGDSTFNKNIIGLNLYENTNRTTLTMYDAANVLRYASGANDSLVAGPAYVVMGVRNATHLNAYTNGVLGPTVAALAGSAPISGTSQARLWAREDFGVANAAKINGNCFGVICIAAELDSTRRGQVERYLASKAGVTL